MPTEKTTGGHSPQEPRTSGQEPLTPGQEPHTSGQEPHASGQEPRSFWQEPHSFWQELPRPHFSLAPMEDVTDTVFRELVASVAAPGRLHLVFTEFMSVDGFLHEVGRERVAERLVVSEREREVLRQKGIRLIAQIWGSDPEKFYRAGRAIAQEYEFDGLDINMGCPVKKITKHGACSALIRTPEIAKEIVTATREGSGLPVSVKTRTGFNEVVTESWTGSLLEARPDAITLHGRTQKQQSDGEADWSQVRLAAQLRDAQSAATVIAGNGDVMSYQDGISRAREFGADGIMVGRGIFHNPALFSDPDAMDHAERMELLVRHLTRFREMWEGKKNYAILKRFFKIYVHSFEGAGSLRASLMDTRHYDEALALLERFRETFPAYQGL